MLIAIDRGGRQIMKTLEQIVNSSETAKNVFSFWASRERYRKEPMHLWSLRKKMKQKGIKFDKDEMHQLFKDLEAAGYGFLTYSLKHPYVFTWHKNFLEVSKLALSLVKKEPTPINLVKTRELMTKTISMPLTKGWAQITLPVGATPMDYFFISEQLKSLTA